VLSTERDQRRAARAASEARDHAQFILGGISLVIWFVVAFTLAVIWFVDEYTAQPLFMAGGIAFLVAALPWLAYKPLTRRLLRARGK
jgi:uncharacterized membrane protein